MSTISASTTTTTAYKVAADTTGTLVLQTGATPTTAVYIDTAQNVGVGVTPSAWGTFKGVDFLGSGAVTSYTGSTVGGTALVTNAYYNASSWIYKAAGSAANFTVDNGFFTWRQAAAGSAGGTITYTQAMTLDASGNLLVGTTSTGNARILGDGGASYHGVRGTVTAAGNVGIYGNHSSNSATGYVAYFQNTGSGTGLYISNTAAWQSVSDSRLKDDVRDLTTTSKLLQLRPVDYLWKNQATSDEPEKRSMGFIAQEVQEVFPELVGVSPDGFFSVEYTGLIAPLVKAIQEQQALITQLQADVAALKGAA